MTSYFIKQIVMEFGYWPIKGLAEPIRWTIAHLKVAVNEKAIDGGEWFGGDNAKLGLDFPNLPYLVDGDFKLTESSAIPHYLADKAGKPEYNGKDAKEQATLRMLEGVTSDLRTGFGKVFKAEADHKKLAEAFFDKASGDGAYFLHKLSHFLGTKEFFVGHPTIFDIGFAYYLSFVCKVLHSIDYNLDHTGIENLKAHHDRVVALPGIKEIVEARKNVPFMPPGMLKFELK
jgi:glutathione S-transferase